MAAVSPGSLRRFIAVLSQLDLTYDLFGVSGKDIVSILPPEFDQWRKFAPRKLRDKQRSVPLPPDLGAPEDGRRRP